MATSVAAMKARLGDTDYFILSMKAKELSDKVVIPRESEEWKALSIEERYQREIAYSRVKQHIAPYLANNKSRFFGAIIVAAENFEDTFEFQALSDVTTRGLTGWPKAETNKIGLLTFSGGEVLYPLDGQHRVKAIKFAISGRDEQDKEIDKIAFPCSELAQEDVTVILVPFERKKARQIFTHVNLHARKPTTGQNIVTNDDDVVAILGREIANDLVGARLVKFQSNTLTDRDYHFTTLSTIYNCNEAIITAITGQKLKPADKAQLPKPEKTRMYRNAVRQVWAQLLEGIETFQDALNDKEVTGDEKRCELRMESLLGKPVAQECLVRTYLRLVDPSTNLSKQEACDNLNKLPWAINAENLKVWDRVLWMGGTDGKIDTKNRNLATDLIAYLAGEKLSDESKAELLEKYRAQFPDTEREGKELPPRYVN